MRIPSRCAWIMVLLALLAGREISVAETRYAVADGAWNNPAVWSAKEHGQPGASVPGRGDTVVIGSGAMAHTITIPDGITAQCAALQMGTLPRNSASGIVELTGADSRLEVAGDVAIFGPSEAATRAVMVNAGQLLVNGSLSLGEGQTWTQNVAVCKVVVTTGTVTVAGDLHFNVPSGGASNQCQIILAGTGTFNLAGAFTAKNNLGMIVPATGSTFNFNGRVPQIIPFTSEIRYHNLHINNTSVVGATIASGPVPAVVEGDLRIEHGVLRNGARQISGDPNGTFHVNDGATFIMSGTSTMVNGFGATSFAPNATVCYAGFDQDIIPGDYGNLVIASAGRDQSSKRLAGGTRIHGDLTIASGNDVTIVVASGDVAIDGNLLIGEKNWFMAGNNTITIGGELRNDGTFAAGQGTVVLNGGTEQTISGQSATRFNNLTVASAELALNNDIKVGSLLRMEGGNVITGNHAVIIGDDTVATGELEHVSGAIVGNVRRWVNGATDDIVLPVGVRSAYRPAHITFTTLPVRSGLLTASFVEDDPAVSGLPLKDGGTPVNAIGREGYWRIESSDGLAGGIYNLDLTADQFRGIANPASLRVLTRLDQYNGWELDGTHNDGVGTDGVPVARRSDLHTFGDFSIGGGEGNPLSSAVAGVHTNDTALTFHLLSISPNPASEQVNVALVLGTAGPVSVELVSVDGRELGMLLRDASYGAGEHHVPLSIKGLAPGSYMLRVTGGGTTVSQRFVVLR